MSKGFVHPGEQYTVRSAVDDMTVVELQEAGTVYPQWVLDEYMQLPNNITARTRDLAKNIASGISNPYDITIAVTDYLRNNIEYNQSISQPPPNQERIDWFLFDYRKGFCNYYASAEVILLRSLGIPARMAVGFAQGEREIPPIQAQPGVGQGPVNEQISETSTYVVRHKDAHAWPEVYFPGFGWVIFEPTVSQPALFRPSGEEITNVNERQQGQNPDDAENPLALNDADQQRPGDNESASSASTSNFWTLANIIKLIFLLIALAILGFVIWQVRRGFKVKPFLEQISIEIPEKLEIGLRRLGIRPPGFLVDWIYLVNLPALSRSYLEINQALKRIGRNPGIQDTPFERKASLVDAIPSTSLPAERLLAEYQISMYSPHQADAEIARKASVEIRKLSWLERLRQLLARFQEPSHHS
jgi:transglutaminase-like putative cysteine protease